MVTYEAGALGPDVVEEMRMWLLFVTAVEAVTAMEELRRVEMMPERDVVRAVEERYTGGVGGFLMADPLAS